MNDEAGVLEHARILAQAREVPRTPGPSDAGHVELGERDVHRSSDLGDVAVATKLGDQPPSRLECAKHRAGHLARTRHPM
jgi:hypothetical protein